MMLTDKLIDCGRSKAGGWSRPQLACLGVAWPPRRGWKRALVGTNIQDAVYNKFLSLKNRHLIEEGQPKDEGTQPRRGISGVLSGSDKVVVDGRADGSWRIIVNGRERGRYAGAEELANMLGLLVLEVDRLRKEPR